MDETVAFYRREATLAGARALTAESAADRLRLALDVTVVTLDERDAEIVRLRRLVEQQAAELAQLRAQLADALETRRRVTLATIIGALGEAVERGDGRLEGRTVAAARAEIRAALSVESGATGFTFAAPGVYPSNALSTVTVDLRRLPPSPVDEARARSLAAVDAAVLELQAELDRGWSATVASAAGVALVQAAAFLTAPSREVEALRERLVDLAAALVALGEQLPELAAAAGQVEAARIELPASPQAAPLADIAQRLRNVVASLPPR